MSTLPVRMRRLLALSGGKWAFAWSSYAILFLPASLAVAALEAPTGFTTLGSIGVGLLSVSASFITGAVYVGLFMRGRASRPASWPVQVGFWVAAGAVLGLTRAFCVLTWSSADPELVLRLVGSIAGSCVWVPAIAVVQAVLDQRRERLEQIESMTSRLERVRATAEMNLDEQVASMSAIVRTSVEPHLLRLSERLGAVTSFHSAPELNKLVSEIETVSADVVRLTSHRILDPGGFESSIPKRRRPRIFGQVLVDVLRRPIMWPWVGALMIVVGTGPEIYRTAGPATLLLGVVSVSASTVVLTLVEQYTKRLSDAAAAAIQWGLVVVISVGVGLVPPLVAGIGPDFEVDTQLTPLFLFAPLVALATVMTSIAVSTRRHTLELMDELELRNAELRAVATDAHLQADDVRRRVAALLHGPVQGRLSAAAMLLSLHVGDEAGRTAAEVFDETEQLLKEASRDLESLAEPPTERESLGGVLDRLENDWRGIIAISWSCDPAAEAVLEADTGVLATVSELVVDMVTNAARHGRARRAEISVGIISAAGGRGRHALEVRCHNDGTFAPAAPSEGGLVKALLRSMSGEWVVSGEDGSVDSVALIPITGDVRHANVGPAQEFAI